MIPAAKVSRVPLTLDDDGAAMSADVRHAPDFAVVIGREEQRLIQATVEQREGGHASRRFYARCIAYILPAAREDAVLLRFEVFRIGINPRRQGRRTSDVLVDLEVLSSHYRSSAVWVAGAPTTRARHESVLIGRARFVARRLRGSSGGAGLPAPLRA